MMQRASNRGPGDPGSSSSSSSGSIAIGNNEDGSSRSPSRSRSPSLIVRTGGSVHRHKRRDLPWGIRIVQKLSDWWFPNSSSVNRDFWYRVSVLVLTYMSYMTYHMSRKPISIVKNVLNQNCSATPSPGIPALLNSSSCGWAPFDREDADVLLGTLDSAFLFAYAAGMFVSGFIAERVNLRYFLSLGMLLSGLFTYLFGLAYSRNIHNLSYFILVQALGGVLQTTGWPGVVTVVGNWFGKGKRGLIFGLWNSHTSVGNILGSIIAGEYVESNWGLSFIVPGAVIGVAGFLIFLFLVPKPQHVHCTLPDHSGSDSTDLSQSSDYPSTSSNSLRSRKRNGYGNYTEDCNNGETSGLLEVGLPSNEDPQEDTPMIPVYDPEVKIKAVGFTEALKIPGVIEFSLCLFFAKLVSYTFLYWLPRYIKNSTPFSAAESGNLSTLFDVGGIIGGVIAGVISDYTGMSATTCAGMLTVAVPMMFIYQDYGSENLWTNILLLILVGILVNGPYALITTAVSTELGTHPCLMGNARALATVTAIIDGTGSIGAAVGPLLAGPVSSISKEAGWKYVFIMLMVADVIALVLLVRLVSHEFKRFFETRHANRLKLQKLKGHGF